MMTFIIILMVLPYLVISQDCVPANTSDSCNYRPPENGTLVYANCNVCEYYKVSTDMFNNHLLDRAFEVTG